MQLSTKSPQTWTIFSSIALFHISSIRGGVDSLSYIAGAVRGILDIYTCPLEMQLATMTYPELRYDYRSVWMSGFVPQCFQTTEGLGIVNETTASAVAAALAES